MVFKECVIDNKFLPHGTVDIVCGCLGTDSDYISIKLSVAIDKPTHIDNPQLIYRLNRA